MLDIRQMLRSIYDHYGLDVVLVGRFAGSERPFRHQGPNDRGVVIRKEGSEPLAGSCLDLVLRERLPDLFDDAAEVPAGPPAALGAYLHVPILTSDGTLFGSLCCISEALLGSRGERDVAVLRTFAEIIAGCIERDLRSDGVRLEKERRVRRLIDSGGPAIVFQPVFMLDDMRIAGSEALSRFPSGRERPVDLWFRDAAEVGLQVELELTAIRNALRDHRDVWDRHRVQLGLNASVATILDERLCHALEGYPRELIVIELTEHEEVHDYAALLAATNRLRAGGTRIAVDDVGAGYASMRHVLTMRPDILKLDVGLIRSIDADDLRAALASSLQHFADQFACQVVAEGVETREELAMLRRLGLQAVQGYLLAAPGSPEALLASLEDRSAAAPDGPPP